MKSTVVCALAYLLYGCSLALAGDHCCCQECGCQANCQKVCRLVCETKKTPKITYDCECEDFCVPKPAQRSVACNNDCDSHCKEYVFTPTCATVYTRNKLIKVETMVEKPSYKWVVETVCDGCAARCASQTQSLLSTSTASISLPPTAPQRAEPTPARAVQQASATEKNGQSGFVSNLLHVINPFAKN